MNQSNNYNFDPMTGQPILQQTIQNSNINNVDNKIQNKENKNNNKLIIIIVVLIILCIVEGILLFTNIKSKEKCLDSSTDINSSIKNNDSEDSDNSSTNQNSTGSVEEGTNTTYDAEGAFLFAIEDVFTITGRGTIVTGIVERGTVKVGDTVQIIGMDQKVITTQVKVIQAYNQEYDDATIGQNVGILLKDVEKKEVKRGQILSKPNSIASSKKFEAEVSFLSEEDGGMDSPFYDGFKSQFYFRTTNINGIIDLQEGIEKVNPGDTVTFTVTLEVNVAMEIGTKFTVKEDGHILGEGTITKVY